VREIIDISPGNLAVGYLLFLVPISIVLVYRVRVVGDLLTSVLRMTVQLLFVGFYLQVVFELDRWWLTALWLLVMTAVADFSVLRGARLSLRRMYPRVFVAILAGSLIPLAYFVLVILRVPGLMEPQYVIPIMGMIMGNCLRANIIGIGRLYQSIRERDGAFLYALGQGATLREAVRPFMRTALRDALSPSIATMMTIGLVALPGMMTGILMAGVSPMAAVKYQIAIMIAIFSGTAITVAGGMELTLPRAFSRYGVLRGDIFRERPGRS
jgi:putative ABC transport system permease protein